MYGFPWVTRCVLLAGLILLPAHWVCAEENAADDPFGSGEQSTDERSFETGDRPAGHKPSSRDLCRCLGETDPGAVDRIKRVLNAPLRSTGIKYTEAPLGEVISDFGNSYGIPIQIDRTALEEIGLSTDVPVTAQLNNISLRSALRLMLERFNLTYIIKDEVLLITTPEEAEAELLTCIYDVRNLVDKLPEPKGASAWADYDPLVGAITSCIHPETWKENGGAADLRALHPGFLVVMQTRAVHDEVKEFLVSLREMRNEAPAIEARQSAPTPGE